MSEVQNQETTPLSGGERDNEDEKKTKFGQNAKFVGQVVFLITLVLEMISGVALFAGAFGPWNQLLANHFGFVMLAGVMALNFVGILVANMIADETLLDVVWSRQWKTHVELGLERKIDNLRTGTGLLVAGFSTAFVGQLLAFQAQGNLWVHFTRIDSDNLPLLAGLAMVLVAVHLENGWYRVSKRISNEKASSLADATTA